MAVRTFNNGNSATVSSSAFPLTFSDIAATLGGSTPHSLSEYYGYDNTSGNTAIPSSGTLAIQRDFQARPRPQKPTATGINIVNINSTQAVISLITSTTGNYGDLLYAMAQGGPATYPGGLISGTWGTTNSFTVTRGTQYTIWALRRNWISGSDNYGYSRNSGWWRTVS